MIKRNRLIQHYKSLRVSSRAFDGNGSIPLKYTREGLNISPPLSIKGLPVGAKSMVIIAINPDAPRGRRLHWLAWNIPATPRIREGKVLGRQGKNDFGSKGYSGPIPADKIQHLIFKVYALDSILGKVDKEITSFKLQRQMAKSVVAYGEITGKIARKKTVNR